jgi:hypothetical protein
VLWRWRPDGQPGRGQSGTGVHKGPAGCGRRRCAGSSVRRLVSKQHRRAKQHRLATRRREAWSCRRRWGHRSRPPSSGLPRPMRAQLANRTTPACDPNLACCETSRAPAAGRRVAARKRPSLPAMRRGSGWGWAAMRHCERAASRLSEHPPTPEAIANHRWGTRSARRGTRRHTSPTAPLLPTRGRRRACHSGSRSCPRRIHTRHAAAPATCGGTFQHSQSHWDRRASDTACVVL